MLQREWGICFSNTDLQSIKDFWFIVQQEIHQEAKLNHHHLDVKIFGRVGSNSEAPDQFHF